MRKQIAAANWKMNLSLEQGLKLIDDIIAKGIELNDHQVVVLGVPFPYLMAAKERIGEHQISVSAQNCYHLKSGAFTGEVSAAMLASVGVDYVIIGHSERREYFNENHQILAEKVNLAFENNLKPIFCCGEPLSVRESFEQNDYVAAQLRDSLFHLPPEKMTGLVIAYEPIWAIGTGKTATAQQAQEMHEFIRNTIAKEYREGIAETVSILYGGSVKANNAKEIFGKHDVDGGLVGGASLDANEFGEIIRSLK
jgi:triosephosphate isomerase (TIM)